MQRPATHRRQVRKLRHAKLLTGIFAELPVEGQHPAPPTPAKRQYRVELFSSTLLLIGHYAVARRRKPNREGPVPVGN
jgi:hypothetical protein